MKRVEIKMHYFCNNNCIFCVQEDNKEKYQNKGLSVSEIREKLKKGKENNAKEVIFTGGEVSLRFNDLLSSIKYAKRIGYKSIFLLTNGRAYSYQKNARIIAESGVTRATISIHGSSSKKHDSLTRTLNSFDQGVSGIKNLKKENIDIAINCVIVKENISDLENIARLGVSLNVSQVQFAFIHISNSILSDKKRLKNLVPRKKDIISSLVKALQIVEKAGIDAKTEGVPFCLMKKHEKYIGDSNKRLPETSVFEYQSDIIKFKDVLVSKGRVKRKQCISCKYFDACVGPWVEYPQLFGWSEFVPLK